MQLEYIFQNPLVVVVVIFGLSCTMGLSLVVPIVANVILAVFSGWMNDLGQAMRGGQRESAYPEEREAFPKQVIGYDPAEKKEVAPTPLMKVEPDEVPVLLLTQLTVALTLTAAAFIFIAVELFEWRLAAELTDKGYEDIEVIPHVSAE
jgi:hypothetical protein